MGYSEKRDDLCPGQDGVNSMRFHHATQNSTQFKTYELFLEFSIQYFWTMVEHRKLKCRK